MELLTYMMGHKGAVLTSKQLAGVLNISVRSVKAYISQINESGTGTIILANKNGYAINLGEARNLLAGDAKAGPQTYEERSTYVIKSFFLQHANCLELYDIADELFVSDSTLKADIKKMNVRFKSFDIVFAVRKEQMILQGTEQNIRKLFSSVLYEEVDNHYVDLQILKGNFVNIDIDALISSVKQIFSQNGYYINDLALRNMLLHLVIIVDRIQEGKVISESKRETCGQGGVNACVLELCRMLETRFSIVINQAEQQEIDILFKSSTNIAITEGMGEVGALVGAEVLEVTKELIDSIRQAYGINLETDDFIIPFALHLKNLMLRAKNSGSIKNPMLESIQSQHLILFDMALYVSLQLERRCHIYISQDEIAFIALHIGGEVERQKNNQPKARVVLLCPSYMNIETRLYNELLIHFGRDIHIVASVRDVSFLDELKFDLLISIVRVTLAGSFEIAVVSPFLTAADRLEIQAKIENSLNIRKNKVLITHFDDYFEEDLFFISRESLDRLAAIRLLTHNLCKKEYVHKDYMKDVLMREEAASTAFGKVAIPHSVEMNADKTSASVLLCPKGIKWGDQLVYVVLMIAINKLDNQAFRELYESLVIMFSEETNIELFRNCKTYQEFEYTLKSILG